MNIPLLAGRYFTEGDDTASSTSRHHQRTVCEDLFRQSQSDRRAESAGMRSRPMELRSSASLPTFATPALKRIRSRRCTARATIRAKARMAVRSSIPPGTIANEIRFALKATDPDVTFSDVQHDGRPGIDRQCAAAIPDIAADGIRGDCVVSGAGGPLRTDGLLGESPHARSGHPHGARRGTPRCVVPHPQERCCAGWRGLFAGLACAWA